MSDMELVEFWLAAVAAGVLWLVVGLPWVIFAARSMGRMGVALADWWVGSWRGSWLDPRESVRWPYRWLACGLSWAEKRCGVCGGLLGPDGCAQREQCEELEVWVKRLKGA